MGLGAPPVGATGAEGDEHLQHCLALVGGRMIGGVCDGGEGSNDGRRRAGVGASRMTHLMRCLPLLLLCSLQVVSQGPAVSHETLESLHRIMRNILAKPSEPKFRWGMCDL